MDIEYFYEKLFNPEKIDQFLTNPIVLAVKKGWEPQEGKRDLARLYKLQPKLKKVFLDKKVQASVIHDDLMATAYYSPTNPVEGWTDAAKEAVGGRAIFRKKDVKEAVKEIKKSPELSNIAQKLYKAVTRELYNSDETVYQLLQNCLEINKISPEELLATALGAKASYSSFFWADSIEDWKAKHILELIKNEKPEKYEQLVFNHLFADGELVGFILEDLEQIEMKVDRYADEILEAYVDILNELGSKNLVGVGATKIKKVMDEVCILPYVKPFILSFLIDLPKANLATIKKIIIQNIGSPIVIKGLKEA